jgi:hypothetical protein
MLAIAAKIQSRGSVMNTKKLALFAGVAAVVAGGLIYSLGIYPPASMRDGQGAIGKRDVYRADQPVDASVNPGAAPVAMQATADEMKSHALQNGQINQLTDGQLVQLMNGQIYQVSGGKMVQLMNGQFFKMNGQMIRLMNGQFFQMNGQMARQMNGQIFQMHGDQLVQLMNGQFFQMHDNQMVQLMNGQFFKMNGQMVHMMNGQFFQMNGQMVHMMNGQIQMGMMQH